MRDWIVPALRGRYLYWIKSGSGMSVGVFESCGAVSMRGLSGRRKRKAYYLEAGDEDYGNENHVYPDIDL